MYVFLLNVMFSKCKMFQWKSWLKNDRQLLLRPHICHFFSTKIFLHTNVTNRSVTSLLVLRKISIASRNLVDKPVARRKTNFRSRKYLHWPGIELRVGKKFLTWFFELIDNYCPLWLLPKCLLNFCQFWPGVINARTRRGISGRRRLRS